MPEVAEAMPAKRTVTLTVLRAVLRAPSPIAALRALAWPEPPRVAGPLPQLALWVVDADGLPARPWRLYADSQVACTTLRCTLYASQCVARQKASDIQKTKDTWRGEASSYPHCVTEKCAQGRGVRTALDPAAQVDWRGAGPGGRFERSRRDVESVAAARAAQRAVGLLDAPPTIDGPMRSGEGAEP
jgi:hypothetical protein